MHMGLNHEDLEHQDLAIRHLGAGIIKEEDGKLEEALQHYETALFLDPELTEAELKIIALKQRCKQPAPIVF